MLIDNHVTFLGLARCRRIPLYDSHPVTVTSTEGLPTGHCDDTANVMHALAPTVSFLDMLTCDQATTTIPPSTPPHIK